MSVTLNVVFQGENIVASINFDTHIEAESYAEARRLQFYSIEANL